MRTTDIDDMAARLGGDPSLAGVVRDAMNAETSNNNGGFDMAMAEYKDGALAPLWAVTHLPAWLVGLVWFRKKKSRIREFSRTF